mgnify:CR=1 FL=1
MAIVITRQTLYDGPKRAKIQITGASDGSGEVTNAMLVQANTLEPIGPGQACERVKVERVTGNTAYGNVELFWDAPVPLKFAELSGSKIDLDYRDITAIVPPSSLLSWTGNITYSTTGFSAGSTFMLEIELVKAV